MGRSVCGHAALPRQRCSVVQLARGATGHGRTCRLDRAGDAARHHAAPWPAAASEEATRRGRVDREQHRQHTHQKNAKPATHESPLPKREKKPKCTTRLKPPSYANSLPCAGQTNPPPTRAIGRAVTTDRVGGREPPRTGPNRLSRSAEKKKAVAAWDCHGLRGSNLSPACERGENCETDADRAVTGTCFSRIRINALGLAPPTECGDRSTLDAGRIDRGRSPPPRRHVG